MCTSDQPGTRKSRPPKAAGASAVVSENGETSRPVRHLIMRMVAVDLDREACYRAVKARDRRFDGRFLTGVSSTGVFCRPICPARTPRFENCVFFPTAAAAYSAGFRPCLRCRPEINPGVAAWSGTVATVNRALRLIAEEGPEATNLEALASRLGVGSRHFGLPARRDALPRFRRPGAELAGSQPRPDAKDPLGQRRQGLWGALAHHTPRSTSTGTPFGKFMTIRGTLNASSRL